MKLKKEMITHTMDGTQIMVATDKNVFSGIAKSNPTAAFIVDQLKNDTTADQIKKAVFEKYDAPFEVISADVDGIIAKLRSIGAIED